MATKQDYHAWWKEAIIYQVWPASFCDSNGDGWGDIPGITSKLDHIKNLGANVVWTSPIYPSPQVDMGYDIADYKNVDPRYGTLQDMDHLISELKKRDMKLMMDLVVNHTSDQHAWFKESRSSLGNPKRDWYIWKKPKYNDKGQRQPPNNWSMILGEESSAWAWDEKTQEYYLALFTPEQPDLNWESDEVREAVHDVMRFWLDKGCVGFRMDVINHISKVQTFPDAPVVAPGHKYQPGHKYFANGPRMHEWLVDLNRKVLSKYGETITVGEMPFVDDEKEIIRTVGASAEELRMIFIFDMVGIDNGHWRMTLQDWKPKDLKRIISKWQNFMIDNDGWNSVFWENHDNPRSISRYCDDSEKYRELSAKLLAMMHSTLSGTPYVYMGQELGMRNIPKSWAVEEYKDVESQNFYNKVLNMYPGNKEKEAEARHILQLKARDHSRVPVQWSAEDHAGFSTTKPWMRVNEDYKECNAAAQVASANANELTVYQFWKRAIENRKKHKEVFVYGGFEEIDAEHEKIFAYLRTSGKEGDWLVALNFTGEEVEWNVPPKVKLEGWMAGNYTVSKPEKPTSGTIIVQPWESLLGKCVQ